MLACRWHPRLDTVACLSLLCLPADQSRATEIRGDGNVCRSDLGRLWPVEVLGDCADQTTVVWLLALILISAAIYLCMGHLL